MLTLYPSIVPYKTHQLKVDSIHTLYIEECGEPNGIPILFLHGGPGAGICDDNRRFFDPQKYRIILFDQRGCGNSEPYGELKNNNCAELINDIKKIREYLMIDSFVIFGGSWGSTLALLYSQAFPNHVKGLILRGIFLARSKDVNWLYQDGANKIFPDYWQEFISIIPAKERSHILKAYYKILTNGDDITKMAAARAWAKWEASCSTLEPCKQIINNFTKPHLAIAMAKIATHFFLKDPAILKSKILENMHKIAHIPGIIVHGRYDLVCPVENAFLLANTWKNVTLNIIRDAGHSGFEPAIVDALVHATQNFIKNFSK
jgi:proline iminopeptidase